MNSQREVFVKNEGRWEGEYSIYIRNAPNGAWYTGLTFGAKRDCDKVVAVIRSLWLKV